MADDGRREIWATLEPSTFRGVPWFIETISVAGGRKATAKPIVNSDQQVVDDVGLKQRVYKVQGYITAKYRTSKATPAETITAINEAVDQRAAREAKTGVLETGPVIADTALGSIQRDYREVRLALSGAFEAVGSASLVHPIEGEIENLICKEFSIDESMKDVGIGRVAATFVRETTTPIPEPVVGAIQSVLAFATLADAAADAAITGPAGWAVTQALVNGFEAAAAKVSDFYDKALEVSKSVATVADEMDQFIRDVAALEAIVFETVATAVGVADSVKGVFAAISGVFSLPAAAFQALQNGFDFGDTDINFDISTPSGKQKKANFDAMNVATKCRYLNEAYRVGTELDYITTQDVADVEAILEAQYRKIMDDPATDPCVRDALTALRESFFDFLGAARLQARSLVEEDVATMTPRVLAYQLYEDDADTATLAGLNGVAAYETISGAVTVLSE